MMALARTVDHIERWAPSRHSRQKARSDLRRAASASVPPSVTRQVRQAEVLALPLARHLDVDRPAIPLQDAPQLSAAGNFPNVSACLLQAAWTVARDRPVAVDDRAHFSPFTAIPPKKPFPHAAPSENADSLSVAA